MIGLAERSSSTLARLGEGWRLNRRGIALLRETYGDPDQSGPLKAVEVDRFTGPARSLGWRFIEREAEYLHETGRTNEARRLLESAIALAKPDLERSSSSSSFYPLKLVGALASIEGFVGDEKRAIALHEQEYALAKPWAHRRNLLRIRMNLLAEQVDYQGADTGIIEEAAAIAEEYVAAGYPQSGAMKRMHARIAASQISENEQIERLVEAARKGRDEEDELNAFYASRNELFVRAGNHEPGLDSEFHAYILRTREQGNLRAEPRIYRRYADWLVGQGRYPEGIRAYRTALERTLAAEWHPLVPLLYGKIAASLLLSGQPGEAERAWSALKQYAETHPSIPPHQLLRGHYHWFVALLKTARIDNNPFVGMPVEHTIHFPKNIEHALPFRIRSETIALRIEYRDPKSGRVLAIDNNGNGDFTEPGDFWTPGSTTAAPVVRPEADTRLAGIEVWYFPNQTGDTADELPLSIELFLDGTWTRQAVDLVKPLQ